MSPHIALRNSIFLTYVFITVGILIFAGMAIGLRQRRKDVRAVWLTYRSWLIMVPAIGLCILLGRWAVVGGATLLAVLAFHELARASDVAHERFSTAGVYLLLVVSAIACVIQDPLTHQPGWMRLFQAMPVVATPVLLSVPIFLDKTSDQLRVTSVCLLGFLQGWLFLHLAFLVNTTNSYGYLPFILLATELNDVAAFTVGRLFGRHPLRPTVSPKKTWEGAIGAAAFSVALPFVLRFSLPHLPAWKLLMIGFIVGIGGQLGDLSVSVIKRDLNIKDLGSAIPGHGGILDRIDSLTFVAPLFLYVIL